jgi:diguanylate cyclase (GGDEF)-like protein/PAS domain S-box-containing protein
VSLVDGHLSGGGVDEDIRWRIAVESSKAGLWDHDIHSNKQFNSPEWFFLRGRDPEKEPAYTVEIWRSRIHPDDLVRVVEYTDRVNRGEIKEIAIEYRERHADGHWIWILSRGRVIFGENGKAVRYIGTDTDVTALKDAQLNNLEIMHRFKLAVSESKVGFWEYDISTDKSWWDKNTCELFGYTSDEKPLASEWKKIIHPDDVERASKVSADAIKNRTSHAMDYRIVLQNGDIRHIRTRGAFYSDPVLGEKQIGLNWDVTEDYLLSIELQKAKQLAEHRNEELEAARVRMEYNSLHDALTGLANRRQLDRKLNSIQLSVGLKVEERVAILHVDLDRFKEINDSMGHLVGDVTLQRASNILRECAPNNAQVSRAGGDEFIIVIDNAPDDEALAGISSAIVEKIREPMHYGGQDLMIGASIGVAVARVGTINGKQLLMNSDLALYRAKDEGRSRFCFFTPEMGALAAERKRSNEEILNGLQDSAFFPAYQLQFDAKTLDIVAVEVLARWNHPERGVLTPAEFMSNAEDVNAVARIEEMIFAKALEDMKAWRRQGIMVPRLAFNVSARRLSETRLMNQIRNHGLAKDSVLLGLQDPCALRNGDEGIVDALKQLRDSGISLELGNFGTENASIACLIELRPERFKISNTLLSDVIVSVEKRRLVASIIGIGKALGIDVVAVGAESQEHMDVLQKLDCDVLQGFGLAEPMDAVALASFVQQQRWRKAA